MELLVHIFESKTTKLPTCFHVITIELGITITLFLTLFPPIFLKLVELFTALLFLAESCMRGSEFGVHGVNFYTEQQNADSREGSKEEFLSKLHYGIVVVERVASPRCPVL